MIHSAGALTGALLNGSNFGQIAKATLTGALWGAVSGLLFYGSADDVLLQKLFKHTFSQGWLEGVQGGNMFHGMMMGAISGAGGHYIDKKLNTLGKAGEIAASAVLGGTVDELGGGKFANGAITSAFSIMFNDLLHSKERIKRYVAKKIAKIKKEIEKDGELSFPEAYLWYKIGRGENINVDASKIDLNYLDVKKLPLNEAYSINLLQDTFNPSQGLVYGSINIKYLGNNQIQILPDQYNFDIHPWSNWKEDIRNIETIYADFIHGIGTPFWIYFNGINTIKK